MCKIYEDLMETHIGDLILFLREKSLNFNRKKRICELQKNVSFSASHVINKVSFNFHCSFFRAWPYISQQSYDESNHLRVSAAKTRAFQAILIYI